MDFIRGAALGIDGLGKPIIAMSSITENGESKIVPELKIGYITVFHCRTLSVINSFKLSLFYF